MSELHFRRKVGVALLALLIAAALSGESAYAARLLKAEVEVDGQIVLQTAYSDSGREKPATVWRYLAGEPGWAETAKIVADEADPQRARLKGNIVIRIQHGGSPVVQATASELELMRIGSPGDRWFLPEAELERVAAANGIQPPLARRIPDGGMLIALVAGMAAMVTIAGVLAWIVWPRKRVAAREASG